ncbi:MAG: hypothetical protein JWO76_2965 [Nocardioides sp.]|nr:hypothetical protein [Nocardioides sp.]
MIRHVFAWQVAPGHDNDKIIELLNRLSDEMDFIVSWSVGKHVGEPNENGDPWDGALITDFASWDDLERYSTAPFHMEIVDQLLPMVSGRVVVDFEVDA